jgi:hypothetical protein
VLRQPAVPLQGRVGAVFVERSPIQPHDKLHQMWTVARIDRDMLGDRRFRNRIAALYDRVRLDISNPA